LGDTNSTGRLKKKTAKVFESTADNAVEEESTMRIILGKVIAPGEAPAEEPVVVGHRRRIKDRRKNRVDRRRSVRDGVVVTLSNRKERRSGRDRRKRTS
jgi:hypothetical protein